MKNNKKPFMMKPGSRELNTPGTFRADSKAMLFKPKDFHSDTTKVKKLEKALSKRKTKPTRGDSIRLAHHKMHMDAKTQYATDPFYKEHRKEGEQIAKKFPSLNEYLSNPKNRGKLGYDYEKPKK